MNVLDTYLATCAIQKIDKGTMIVLQDEVPESGFALRSGIVKLCNVTTDGVEKTLSFITTNGIFPVCWLFSKTERPLFYYQAHTDCELAILDKTKFTSYVQSNAKAAYALLDTFIGYCVADGLQLNALTQTSAAAKLPSMLRHLCLRYGKDVHKDSVRIDIPLTQQELANIVGLTRETTVIELNKLKRRHVLCVVQQYYTVNTALLNAIIDDEYSPGVKLA